MDKKALKEFAVMARNELMQEVELKANSFGVSEDSDGTIQRGSDYVIINDVTYPKSYENAYYRLIELKKEKGFEELIEEVAYTWFNRFIALRFMEVNDYLPSHVRVLSSKQDGKVDPDILEDFKECDLEVDENEIDSLLNSGSTEGAYRKLLIAQCNKLSKMMPFLFEEIHDYTEMLLPDKLLVPESVINKLVYNINEHDFTEAVEIIGWIYQYYISEKKDKVFSDLKKNIKITKENIPAATQLFTPDWIVKYMVENSLGRLWLEGHPNPELQSSWKYYLEEAEQEPEVEEELKKIREEHSKLKPEDIKILDPCMGSGHILVYAFDVLFQIYVSCGYSEKDIPRLILENNLYGLDIDDRAGQLTSFALIMKARSYSRRFFRDIERNPLELNVCAIQESRTLDKKGEKQISGITQEEVEYFSNGNEKLTKDLEYLVNVFTDAKEYGSLIEINAIDSLKIMQRLTEIEKGNFMFNDYRKVLLERIPKLIKQARIMREKYDICITNPPYMGNKSMNKTLKSFMENKYKEEKTELYSAFIEKCYMYTKKNRFTAMITQQSWMFLSFFEKLRAELFKSIVIVTMAHLGARAFEEISGEVVQSTSFVLRNYSNKKYMGKFSRLTQFNNSNLKRDNLNNIENIYISSISDFEKIPSKILAYWPDDKIYDSFNNNLLLGNVAKPRQGVKTLDNDRFLKLWFEVSNNKIRYNIKSIKESIESGGKWFPYNKGGTYRKWYGNNEYVVNWENDGEEMKKFAIEKYNSVTRTITNIPFFFKDGITWSTISSGSISMRNFNSGFIFDSKGSSMFFSNKNDKMYTLGLLNSKVANEYLKILSPTLDFNVGPISSIPLIKCESRMNKINRIINNSIGICKAEWDSFETSWDFKIHPLLKNNCDKKLQKVFLQWENECENNFCQLKYNEEELNKTFIDIYGLQDELTPEVDDEDITIRKANRERDIKSLISYAVGCMFGRYSIDAKGLIYAGGDFEDKWKFYGAKCKVKTTIEIPEVDLGTINEYIIDSNSNLIDKQCDCKEDAKKEEVWVDATFKPDKDNIIPITENEYFEDDIVSRFVEFIKTVYGEETLNENLDYIAETLVKKTNETSKERIRRYFVDEFFKDHCKIYQKRPIYWLVDSGKHKGFKALIYLHRYNKETLATMRLNYLLELQGKYINEEKQIERNLDSTSLTASDKKKYAKQLRNLSQKQNELVAFDKILDQLANEKIELDLDDGVVGNYKKLQPILAKIK